GFPALRRDGAPQTAAAAPDPLPRRPASLRLDVERAGCADAGGRWRAVVEGARQEAAVAMTAHHGAATPGGVVGIVGGGVLVGLGAVGGRGWGGDRGARRRAAGAAGGGLVGGGGLLWRVLGRRRLSR